MNSISTISHHNIQRMIPTSNQYSSEIAATSSSSYNESFCTSTVHGRIHQVHALAQRLKCFSSSEVLLSILMANLNDLSNQRVVDASGLSYLSGVLLAGMIARQVGTIPISNYRPIPSEKVSPVGMRLDVKV